MPSINLFCVILYNIAVILHDFERDSFFYTVFIIRNIIAHIIGNAIYPKNLIRIIKSLVCFDLKCMRLLASYFDSVLLDKNFVSILFNYLSLYIIKTVKCYKFTINKIRVFLQSVHKSYQCQIMNTMIMFLNNFVIVISNQ
jgi:hypothetical protein